MAAAIRALKGAGEQAKYAGAQTVANAGSNFAGQAGTALNTIDTSGQRTQTPQQQPVYYNQANNPYGVTTPQQNVYNQNPYDYNTQTIDPNANYFGE